MHLFAAYAEEYSELILALIRGSSDGGGAGGSDGGGDAGGCFGDGERSGGNDVRGAYADPYTYISAMFRMRELPGSSSETKRPYDEQSIWKGPTVAGAVYVAHLVVRASEACPTQISSCPSRSKVQESVRRL